LSEPRGIRSGRHRGHSLARCWMQVQPLRGSDARPSERCLQSISYAARPNGHHLWLSLPPQWNRAEFLSRVLRQGLAVVGDDAFAVGNIASPAVRISLGAACNRAELAQALQCLADTLKSPARTGQIV